MIMSVAGEVLYMRVEATTSSVPTMNSVLMTKSAKKRNVRRHDRMMEMDVANPCAWQNRGKDVDCRAYGGQSIPRVLDIGHMCQQ
jgi:hypothetical protein